MTAVHRAIADDLRDAIRSGTLAPGARLPGIRALGEQYGEGEFGAAAMMLSTILSFLTLTAWMLVLGLLGWL